MSVRPNRFLASLSPVFLTRTWLKNTAVSCLAVTPSQPIALIHLQHTHGVHEPVWRVYREIKSSRNESRVFYELGVTQTRTATIVHLTDKLTRAIFVWVYSPQCTQRRKARSTCTPAAMCLRPQPPRSMERGQDLWNMYSKYTYRDNCRHYELRFPPMGTTPGAITGDTRHSSMNR